MAYDPGAIDATLAAAVGDEPALIAELREAFHDGVQRCLETMKTSESPDGWAAAALRLKGLSASIGAAIYPRHGQDPDALVAHADAAMYAAKHSGKNRFRWEPLPNAPVQRGAAAPRS